LANLREHLATSDNVGHGEAICLASLLPMRSGHYSRDMTDEMLDLANENKRKAGVENVEFLKGEIEHIPLPNSSVDVIISECASFTC